MKKILRKTMAIALIASMLLVAIPMVASAAENEVLLANISVADVGDNSGSVTALALLTDVATSAGVAGAEATVLVASGEATTLADADLESKIVYINQVTTDASGLVTIPTFKVATTGTYSVFFGGTGVATPTKVTVFVQVGSTGPVDRHIVYGNVDGSVDGQINTNDLTILTRYIAGVLTTIPNDTLLAANVDTTVATPSYEINTNDLTVLTRYIAGVIMVFPAGTEVVASADSYILGADGVTHIADYGN